MEAAYDSPPFRPINVFSADVMISRAFTIEEFAEFEAANMN